MPLESTHKTLKVLRSDGKYYRESPVCLVQIVEYVSVEGVFIRCVETNGKLKDETYSVNLEQALEYAELLYKIKKDEWKSTET